MIHNKLVQIVMDFNNNVETVRESLLSHIFTLAVYFTTVAVDIEQRETTNVNTNTDICCTLTGHASAKAKFVCLFMFGRVVNRARTTSRTYHGWKLKNESKKVK